MRLSQPDDAGLAAPASAADAACSALDTLQQPQPRPQPCTGSCFRVRPHGLHSAINGSPERKGGGPRAGIRVSGLDPAWPCPRGLHPPCPRPAGSGTGAHARSAAQPRACSSVARQLELLARLTAAVPGRNVPSLARPGEALAVTVRVRGATARRVGCYGSKRGRAFGEHPRFVRQRSASRSSTATGAGGRSRVCDGRLVGTDSAAGGSMRISSAVTTVCAPLPPQLDEVFPAAGPGRLGLATAPVWPLRWSPLCCRSKLAAVGPCLFPGRAAARR